MAILHDRTSGAGEVEPPLRSVQRFEGPGGFPLEKGVFGVDYDRPLWGEHLRLAAGGAFVTASKHGGSISQTFAGAGPGVRHDTGSFDVWAHALFGYRRDTGTYGSFRGGDSGFDGRFAAGIDYPLGHALNLRAGAAYGGNAHVTAGMSFRF